MSATGKMLAATGIFSPKQGKAEKIMQRKTNTPNK